MNKIVLFSTMISLFTAVSSFSINGMENAQYSTNSNTVYDALLEKMQDKVIKLSINGKDVPVKLKLEKKKYEKFDILSGTYKEGFGSVNTMFAITELQGSRNEENNIIYRKYSMKYGSKLYYIYISKGKVGEENKIAIIYAKDLTKGRFFDDKEKQILIKEGIFVKETKEKKPIIRRPLCYKPELKEELLPDDKPAEVTEYIEDMKFKNIFIKDKKSLNLGRESENVILLVQLLALQLSKCKDPSVNKIDLFSNSNNVLKIHSVDSDLLFPEHLLNKTRFQLETQKIIDKCEIYRSEERMPSLLFKVNLSDDKVISYAKHGPLLEVNFDSNKITCDKKRTEVHLDWISRAELDEIIMNFVKYFLNSENLEKDKLELIKLIESDTPSSENLKKVLLKIGFSEEKVKSLLVNRDEFRITEQDYEEIDKKKELEEEIIKEEKEYICTCKVYRSIFLYRYRVWNIKRKVTDATYSDDMLKFFEYVEGRDICYGRKNYLTMTPYRLGIYIPDYRGHKVWHELSYEDYVETTGGALSEETFNKLLSELKEKLPTVNPA